MTQSGQLVPRFCLGQHQINVNLAVTCRGIHLFLPFEVIIAIDFRTAMCTMGSVCRDGVHTVSTCIHNIGAKAYQFIVLIQETQAIAVM